MAKPIQPFRAKVMHSGSKAILMLPDRKKRPDLPFGIATLVVNGESFEASFAKIAVNVVKRVGGKNCLTEILQGFFGSEAGKSGTRFYVEIRQCGDSFQMLPVVEDQSALAA